jgi:hypothetical protein
MRKVDMPAIRPLLAPLLLELLPLCQQPRRGRVKYGGLRDLLVGAVEGTCLYKEGFVPLPT